MSRKFDIFAFTYFSFLFFFSFSNFCLPWWCAAK